MVRNIFVEQTGNQLWLLLLAKFSESLWFLCYYFPSLPQKLFKVLLSDVQQGVQFSEKYLRLGDSDSRLFESGKGHKSVKVTAVNQEGEGQVLN